MQDNGNQDDPIIGRDERHQQGQHGQQQTGQQGQQPTGQQGEQGEDANLAFSTGAEAGGQDTGQSFGGQGGTSASSGAGYGDQGGYGQGGDSVTGQQGSQGGGTGGDVDFESDIDSDDAR